MARQTNLEELTERLTDPDHVSTLSSASLAASLSASLLATLCRRALDDTPGGKAEDTLREIHDAAISLRRDLVVLVEHSADVDRLLAERGPADDPQGKRDLLFASEIPCRIAIGGHALMQLALKVLGRVGLKGLAEVGTASSLAFAAVAGATTVARALLSGASPEPATSLLTREKAERLLRETDAARAHITERILKHLP